jgi:heme exporter protein C
VTVKLISVQRVAFYYCLVLAAVGLAVAPFLIVGAPMEVSMGFVQRIFYFHVPCAWVTFLSAYLCAAGSVAYLFKQSKRGDALALAAAELTVVFGICVLVTGPLWARKAWGVWWVWRDVRLITTLLLWFIFIAYLFVRRYGGPGAPRLAAGLALFAAADVPIIYKAVDMWRTQHPKTTVVSTLGREMLLPLLFSLTTFTVLYVALLVLRLRLEGARRRLDEAHLEAEEAGLLDD